MAIAGVDDTPCLPACGRRQQTGCGSQAKSNLERPKATAHTEFEAEVEQRRELKRILSESGEWREAGMESRKATARIAGLLYLLASLPGIFSLLYVPSHFIVSGNAGATAG